MPLQLLLIEDCADDAELLSIELADAGIEAQVTCVQDERQLRAVLDRRHDLVVSDLALPGFSGAGAVRIIREAGHDCPVIFCSGSPEDIGTKAALEAGAAGYVCKDRLRGLPVLLRQVLAPA